MILLSIGFICIPWIPGLRTLPQHLGVHKPESDHHLGLRR
jgi:hypothetical protein